MPTVDFLVFEHSRDITIYIHLILCTTACFINVMDLYSPYASLKFSTKLIQYIIKCTHSASKGVVHLGYISYHLKSEYPLCFISYFQPITQQYKSRTIQTVIKVATLNNTDDFHYVKEVITCNRNFTWSLMVSKINGTQRRTLVHVSQFVLAKRHFSGC